MEYAILTSTNSPGLESQVRTFIKDGWEPLGGISLAICPDLALSPYVYSQAVIKKP